MLSKLKGLSCCNRPTLADWRLAACLGAGGAPALLPLLASLLPAACGTNTGAGVFRKGLAWMRTGGEELCLAASPAAAVAALTEVPPPYTAAPTNHISAP